jgi:indolepyruvate ferredoxin oxidoreductase beta subunit
MPDVTLPADPTNLIITGVGGQGNVLASRLLGQIMARQGLWVTIGETFGASQRGGSVMSHLRISAHGVHSPQIPAGRAHLVIALEPSEAFRVLAAYGNPETVVIWNTRPIHPVSVIAGEASYPSAQAVAAGLEELSARSWRLEATAQAQKLGNPILGNIMMIGALSAVSDLPITPELFETAIGEMMPPAKVPVNLEAFELGRRAISESRAGA